MTMKAQTPRANQATPIGRANGTRRASSGEILAVLRPALQDQIVIDASRFRVRRVDHPGEALDLLQTTAGESTPQVRALLLDAGMPTEAARELIVRCRRMTPAPALVLASPEADLRQALPLIKGGCFETLILPAATADVAETLDAALADYELRRAGCEIDERCAADLQRKSSFAFFKQDAIARSAGWLEKHLFSNLRQSLSQASGIGSLVALLNMLEAMQQRDGETVKLPADYFDATLENARAASNLLNILEEIHAVSHTTLDLSPMTGAALEEYLAEQVEESTATAASLRGQRFVRSQADPALLHSELLANPVWIRNVLRELLLNACKFSPEKSAIYVLLRKASGRIVLTVLNRPRQDCGPEVALGIPEREETAVFEPFYRRHATVDEAYNSLDLGLGLALVERIVHAHGGGVYARNAHNHFDDAGGSMVSISVELPLARS